jgi:alkylated DNA repair dioxygenase AlkB
MSVQQASLFSIPSALVLPAGFSYRAEAITPESEDCLLSQFRELPFKEFQFQGFEGKRRVVSFGWRYDFNEQKVLAAEPIPAFLLECYREVAAATGFVLPNLQQVLVTEYGPGAPIGWHRDRPAFGEVMGLSLGSSCTFRLRKSIGQRKWERVAIPLERRSAYLLQGPARWEWEHSIPPVEALRYSITFRSLRG